MASAKANLAGLDTSQPRSASQIQRAPKTGARVITKNELADCSQSVGISQPKIVRSVKSRAKRLSDVGACSKAAQKTIEKRQRAKITAMRFFSSPVSPAKRKR